MKPRELLKRIARGDVRNVRFGDFEQLLLALGFTLQRVRGSHRIYAHPALNELMNAQDVSGQAKPYQLRQLLRLIDENALTMDREL